MIVLRDLGWWQHTLHDDVFRPARIPHIPAAMYCNIYTNADRLTTMCCVTENCTADEPLAFINIEARNIKMNASLANELLTWTQSSKTLYRVGKKRGHILMIIILSILNRSFSLEDSVVNLQLNRYFKKPQRTLNMLLHCFVKHYCQQNKPLTTNYNVV